LTSFNENTTIYQPFGFFIMGFQGLKDTNYYFMFLGILYIGTLLGNFFLMMVIWQSEALHTPKYMVVLNLAKSTISNHQELQSRPTKDFLFNSQFVPYNLCLTQMFFIHSFHTIESYSLVILAFERLVSICFPLRSSTIITNTRMVGIIAFCWVLAFTLLATMVALITRLYFCKPIPVVVSYFCDHGPVFKMACSDNTVNWRITSLSLIVVIFLPLAFILASYVCIVIAISRINSAEGRWKAVRTCTAHLILVAMFFMPILVIYTIAWINITVDVNTRILNTSLSLVLPALLNPIIYSLKTEEVMEQIKKLLRKHVIRPKQYF
uniref:G-protein coupled receptors family 1 profile domain-containing protein n=1 Tax=Paramormyrops kingsleyae TaxID=1676925 RepID=A0A3B3T5A6_9TELE